MPEQSRHCCIPTTFEKAPGTSVVVSDLSPRAWGSPPAHRPIASAVMRSIPTCVGLTIAMPQCGAAAAVHPHVRGAHSARTRASPPMLRSIPTCVGLTVIPMNGGRCTPHGPIPTCVGLTHAAAGPDVPGRSIPTCVGLTGSTRSDSPLLAVHPHVRGAHGVRRPRGSVPGSVHPHVRGAHASLTGTSVHDDRSIPTCVGLTTLTASSGEPMPVHPHVRGAHATLWPRGSGGLPVHPHVRGAHRALRPRVQSRDRVHPHVRGAHTPARGYSHGGVGPSPRAWGSPVADARAAGRLPVHPHVRGAHTLIDLATLRGHPA